jgi:hypothetical protein
VSACGPAGEEGSLTGPVEIVLPHEPMQFYAKFLLDDALALSTGKTPLTLRPPMLG